MVAWWGESREKDVCSQADRSTARSIARGRNFWVMSIERAILMNPPPVLVCFEEIFPILLKNKQPEQA